MITTMKKNKIQSIKQESSNTLRTRVVKSKKEYSRKEKYKNNFEIKDDENDIE